MMTKAQSLNVHRAIRRSIFVIAVALLTAAWMQPIYAQQMPKFDFDAAHYDVKAELQPASQSLTAEAKIELVAKTSSRTILTELHPDLRVTSVRLASDNRKLDFQRDSFDPLDLEVTLPSNAQPGMHVTIIVDYTGAFANDDDSPTKDVRLAWIGKDSAYLLLPSRWFPLTDYPSNRYTATFEMTVPDNFALTGTGEAGAPNELPAAPGQPGRSVYTFTCNTPEPAGTFVGGNLQLTPVQAQGISISVFTPPDQTATARGYGDALANVITYFSSAFAPLASPKMVIAQLPDGGVDDFSAPGLLLISAHEWTQNGANEPVLAHLTAQQWWGDQVLPASRNDVWVTDGLAQYEGAIYMEHAAGPAGFRKELTDFAIGSVMFEDAATISQAQNLAPYSQQYQSIVLDKGAMVFHMLRTSMGDAAFNSLLHDFYTAHAGKTASIQDLENLVQTKLPAPQPNAPQLNLAAFFSQWLNSTGIPEFKLDYIVYRTPKGFKVVGKVTQPIETFNMPVQIRVETEGNPVTKTVQVVGTSSPFEIDTFGRPKPDGIKIDPDNDILKVSPALQIRALIAKGEGLAEQGKFQDAISQYQQALALQANNSLADFRMGEAFFYQKNYSASADSFRNALDGDLDPSYRWVEVWSHIYLGKIFDLTGSRERAINEYERAEELKDNTGGAQQEAEKYMKAPYTLSSTEANNTAKPAKP